MDGLCPFCSKDLKGSECVKLYAKGADSINRIRKNHSNLIPDVGLYRSTIYDY